MEFAKQYGAFVAAALLALAGFALGDSAVMAWMAAAVVAAAGVVALSPRWGLLAASAVGLGSSLYLFERKLDQSSQAICNVSSKINCDVVNNSPASELFGVPIALLGAGFFIGVALSSFLRGPNNRAFATAGLLSLVGLAYSAYLGFTSWQLGAVCVMCLSIYASVALVLVASLLGLKAEHEGALFDDLPGALRSNSFITMAATLVVVVLLGMTVYSGKKPGKSAQVIEQLAQNKDAATRDGGASSGQAQPDNLMAQLQEMYVTPRGTVQLEGDEPTLGDPNAPYTVVEFACFGCPHCAQSFPHLRQLVTENPDIQVKFRSFPLSNECNQLAARGGRPEVCRAAMAAQCAGQQGKFWDYASLVFANQHQLGDELLAAAASQLQLDFNTFSSCLTSEATLREVAEDAHAGGALQIMGTPTMFLEGVLGPDQWVEVCFGPSEVMALVQAHKQGIKLPAGRAGTCPMDEH
jgi:protein-disulfide isomerase/uncharacterized membrane protein